MLDADTDVLLLNTLNVGCSHPPRQQWVFRKVFEVAACEWAPLNVNAGTEEDPEPFSIGRYAKVLSQFKQHLVIEGTSRQG